MKTLLKHLAIQLHIIHICWHLIIVSYDRWDYNITFFNSYWFPKVLLFGLFRSISSSILLIQFLKSLVMIFFHMLQRTLKVLQLNPFFMIFLLFLINFVVAAWQYSKNLAFFRVEQTLFLILLFKTE